MKQLENKTEDSKRAMDILDALDEIRTNNARAAALGVDAVLEQRNKQDAVRAAAARSDEAELEEEAQLAFAAARTKRLRDDDEEVLLADYPELDESVKAAVRKFGGIGNAWPAKYYAKVLNAAIDHLVYAAHKFHGVTVDEAKIGLVGHSMGGAGVLYAAATDCVDRIACVASLNPSLGSIESPHDHTAQLEMYASGAPHSGEHGEGEMPFLKNIKAPTLIYGSQAEYNTELFPKSGAAPMWPVFPCTFQQVGARVKELYVDNLKMATCGEAHSWCCYPETTGTFAGGVPLKVVLSFLRRHCAKTDESPPERPANALEWSVPSRPSANPLI